MGQIEESGRWRVHGRVQGVGFRWFVRGEARALGLSGDVCNLADGSVEVRAHGPAEALERLLHRLRQGPPGSAVSEVRALAADAGIPDDGFEIRYDGLP